MKSKEQIEEMIEKLQSLKNKDPNISTFISGLEWVILKDCNFHNYIEWMIK